MNRIVCTTISAAMVALCLHADDQRIAVSDLLAVGEAQKQMAPQEMTGPEGGLSIFDKNVFEDWPIVGVNDRFNVEAVVDLNNDGLLDLVAWRLSTTNDRAFLIQTADQRFVPANSNFGQPLNQSFLGTTGDFTGDGFPDFIETLGTGSVPAGFVRIYPNLLGGGAGACPIDLDKDSTVGFEDLVILLAAWGDCP